MGFLVRAAVLVGVGAFAYRAFARTAKPAIEPTPVTNEFETRLAALDRAAHD